jgi:hydrogenase maturation protein HypF
MLERRLNTPLTSSMGRLFDAVAALAGVRDRASYEGQAAIDLEALATAITPDGSYPFDIASPPRPPVRLVAQQAAAARSDEQGKAGDAETGDASPTIIDTRPLIRAIAAEAGKGVEPARIARRFHSTLVELIVAVCEQVRRASGIQAVALSGGVFLNALLTAEVSARLRQDGFRVYRHRLVPPNDGGLSLGQLAVAAQLG